MTALDLSAPARRVLDRALAAGGGASSNAPPGSPLALPAPGSVGAESPLTRDPFVFVAGKVPAARGRAGAPPPGKPPAPIELSAVVSFPGGSLAIVNDQIVKVGDTVSGYRVEKITDNSVSLRERGAALRTIQLPEPGASPPAPPRR